MFGVAGRRGGKNAGRKRRPHLFFGIYGAVVAAGVVAGSRTRAASPSWALGSPFVHRLEVGLAVGFVLYLVVTGAWLAWHGHYFGSLTLPGGLGGGGEPEPVDPAAERVDAAATDLDRAMKRVDFRFQQLEDAIESLSGRVAVVERRRRPFGAKMRCRGIKRRG